MSPAGLTSLVGLGAVVCCAAPAPAGRAGDDEPQAASPGARARSTSAAGWGRTDRNTARHRRRGGSPRGAAEVNAGSILRRGPARAPYAHAMAGPDILLVEDDEAIAAGLVRVLDS